MNETEPSIRNTIRSGEYLVVQKIDGEQSRIIRITPKQKILIEKLKFNGDSAVGHPYGLFEVVSGECIPMSVKKLKEEQEEREAAVHQATKKEGDDNLIENISCMDTSAQNERVVIAPSALKLEPEQKRQRIDQDKVLEMKNSGKAAQELVAKLVEGSASFSSRTTYSQSKYIRRKAKKHSDRILILQPTIRLLAKSYYLKDPDRIAMLRIDQLGLILQMAGIHHGKNVLIFEQNLGLITSAIVERLGGKGACIHLHRGAIAQSIPALHAMNYDEKTLSTFLPVRIKCVLAGKQLPYDNNRKIENDSEIDKDDEKFVNSAELKESIEEEQSNVRRDARLEKERRGIELMESQQIHSLIIGSRTIDPISVLEAVYPKLASSATVVVYSPHMNVLVDTYDWLSRNNAVNMLISDQMCRIHQVLPDRTHPLMSQYVAGGNVLSAIKVLPA